MIMKKTLIMLLALAAVSISCIKENNLNLTTDTTSVKIIGFGEEAEQGILLVKLASKNDAKPESIADGIEGASVAPAFPIKESKKAIAAKHGLDRWYTVQFDQEASLEEVSETIAKHPNVECVQYNTLIERADSPVTIECPENIITKAGTSALPFNDPKLGVMWNLINNGDKSISATALEGADVGVKDAWRLTAGDPRVIVAVFDQGISISHTDLVDALWVNEAEAKGQEGTDDDNNGYKDDIHGYNFADGKGKPVAKNGADHGTHIAGTIAATNNNGIGVASIAGGSGKGDGVRLMSCQVFKDDGSKASSSTIAKAFHYAADHGACVAQCSYGESSEKYLSDAEYISGIHKAEYDAIKYFIDPANANCEGVETNIVVFASGNYNNSASLYPGALKECISVTAVGPDYLPGGYSNYGSGCDIAAPGGDIVENSNDAPCMILSTGLDRNNSPTYVYKYGTSMACPHVSGVVALGMSYALKIGKKFTREEFISRLLTSAVDIDKYQTGSTMKLWVEGRTYTETDVYAKKNKMGTGLVNAWGFLMALEGTPTYLTTPGETLVIDVAKCIGSTVANFEFTLEMDAADKAALGLTSTPVVNDGKVEITCSKTGAGKIYFRSSVGQAGQINGLDFSQEISIVSRPAVANNGGWL